MFEILRRFIFGYDVFLSYRRGLETEQFVRLLADDLATYEIDCFVDDRSIEPSESISALIKRHIRKCRLFVPILSNGTVESQWMRTEYVLARKSGRSILPINVQSIIAGLKNEEAWNRGIQQWPNWEEFALLKYVELSALDVELTKDVSQAIRKTIAGRTRARMARLWLISALTTTILLLTTLSIYSVAMRNAAENRALVAQSRHLASEAEIALKERDIPLALLLAKTSVTTQDTFESRNALLSAVQSSLVVKSYIHDQPGNSRLNAIAISQNGKTVATASPDGTVAIRSSSDGRTIETSRFQLSGVTSCLALSPDGQVVALGDDKGGLFLKNLVTGHVNIAKMSREVNHVTFSPDGTLLAGTLTSGDAFVLKVIDCSLIRHWTTSNLGMPYAIVFTTNGRVMWACEKSVASAVIGDSVASVFPCKVAAAGSDPERGVIWIVSPVGTAYLADSKPELRLLPIKAPDRAASITRVGDRLMIGTGEGTIEVFRIQNGERLDPIGAFPNSIFGIFEMESAPNGRIVASNYEHTCILDSKQTGELMSLRDVLGVDNSLLVRAIAVGNDGTCYIGTDRNIVVSSSGKTQILTGIGEKIKSMQVTSDGRLFWLDERGEMFRLTKSGPERIKIDSKVTAFYFSAASSTLACGVASGTIGGALTLYSLAGEVKQTQGLTGLPRIRSVFVDDSGHRIAAATESKTLIWLTDRNERFESLEAHPADVRFIEDSEEVVLLDDSNDFANWNYRKGSTSRRHSLGERLTSFLLSRAISADGHLLATTGQNNTVLLWDLRAEQRLGLPFGGHFSGISAMAFSPDAKWLLSVDFDGRACLSNLTLNYLMGRADAVANRTLSEAERKRFLAQ